LMQLVLCAVVGLITLQIQRLPEVEISLSRAKSDRIVPATWAGRLVILTALVFVGMPMLSIAIDALFGPIGEQLAQSSLWWSAARTLFIGVSAAGLSTLAGWLLLHTSSKLAVRGRYQSARLIELCGSIVYVVPPLVIGTGLFVLLWSVVNVFDWVLPIVILVNAMMGLPFVIRTLGPPMRKNRQCFDRLCDSLALSGWNRFRLLDWPTLRKPTGLSAALVAAMAMGDLGVVTLFGTPETATLPLLIYQQLGAYRVPQAAVTAAFLLALCLLVFWVLERQIGGRHDA